MYTWWLDTRTCGKEAYFLNMTEDDKARITEFLDWVRDNTHKYRWVERKVQAKTRRHPYDEYTVSKTQGGLRFSYWRDAAEFKMFFSDLIVDGDDVK